MRPIKTWLLATAGVVASLPAAAGSEIDNLRAEVAQLRQAYEQRIAALEKRLKDAEMKSAAPAAATGTETAAAPVAAPQAGSGNAFNPQISLILDGVYYNDNRRGAGSELLESIDGINHSHAHAGHEHGGLERGFNLRDTELVLSATVSPHFDAWATLTVSSGGDVELEEAFFDTRSLPYGLKVRGGKFLSGIGYLNGQHPHQWDFVDQNLPYRTLLGEHGLNDTGVRLSWLPRTGRWYTQLGVEVLQGREQNFASAGEETPTSREDGAPLAGTAAGELSPAKAGPRLLTLFAKFGPDLGASHAVQFGGWLAHARQHQEIHDHTLEDPSSFVHALEGTGRAWGFDAVYKYDAGRYGGQGNVKIVGEYLRLRKDLKVAFHELGALVGQKREFVQDGFVVQGTYGFAPHWEAGLRYDVTGLTNKVDGPAGTLREWDPSNRWTAALTWRIDHFSLFRLQASRARLAIDGERQGVNQVFVQYQLSLGAHGAHSF